MTSPPSLLSLAPMSMFPPRDGASVRIHGVAGALATHGITCTVVGKDYIMGQDGRVEHSPRPSRPPIGRQLAGLLALLRSGHYNEVKLCNRAWKEKLLNLIDLHIYDFIYINYIFSYPFVSGEVRGRRILIDTGNSEWQWFDRFSENTRNPLVKLLCRSSKLRADAIMAELPAGTVMVHCSMSDLEDYRVRRPDLPHLLVPSGCQVAHREHSPDYSSASKRLLFFGNLSGKMNSDALRFFADEFWPSLADLATMIVAGSSPSRQVRRLCERNRWLLRPDVRSEEIAELFGEAHYMVMPFRYGVGSKLKLLEACGRGIPTITTSAGACGQSHLPPSVTISDSPDEWRSTIARPDPGAGSVASTFSREFHWNNVVAPLVDVIRGEHAREVTA